MKKKNAGSKKEGEFAALAGSAKFILALKMRGSKRNCRKVEKLVMEVLRQAMEEMSWHYTGSGKVDVEWEISPNDPSSATAAEKRSD